MTETTYPKQRDRGGPGRPWPKGTSGNPAGRPKGARHIAHRAMADLGEANVFGITQRVIQQALNGDMVAARIILDRAWPAPKGRLLPIALPPVATPTDLNLAHDVIRSELAGGRITLDEAASLFQITENLRRQHETSDMEARLAELETLLKIRNT